jgi:hypothetical protein
MHTVTANAHILRMMVVVMDAWFQKVVVIWYQHIDTHLKVPLVLPELEVDHNLIGWKHPRCRVYFVWSSCLNSFSMCSVDAAVTQNTRSEGLAADLFGRVMCRCSHHGQLADPSLF